MIVVICPDCESIDINADNDKKYLCCNECGKRFNLNNVQLADIQDIT